MLVTLSVIASVGLLAGIWIILGALVVFLIATLSGRRGLHGKGVDLLLTGLAFAIIGLLLALVTVTVDGLVG